jgi:tungstate transport system permease protein
LALHAFIADRRLLPKLFNRVYGVGIQILAQINIEDVVTKANYFGHRLKVQDIGLINGILPLPCRIKRMLTAFSDALTLLAHFDGAVLGIVLVSLQVSLTALLLGTLIGLPIGAMLATEEFTGKRPIILTLNTLMGVPTVIVGVIVYLLLSRSGPLGAWGWLFTPKGMIVAQTLLTTPLIAALSRQILEDSWKIHRESFLSLRLPAISRYKWLIWDCRFSLTIAILAGLARAISEVGAVMIVGGNIQNSTRTMTTAIALETSKGDLPLALALGIVLLGIVLVANLLTAIVRQIAERRYG